jgi:type IV fimbrial biogenesis protein FimT
VQVARTEAAKRGEAVVLCPSLDGLQCVNDERGYGAGWLVFAEQDSKRPPQRSAAEPLIYSYRAAVSGSIVGNRPYFDFRPIMRRSTNGTLVFCDERGAAAARAVIVSYTGRPRVDTVDPDGRRLVCAIPR